MKPACAGALILSAACLFPVGKAHAQNAAAFAKLAARSADAFDTLVTPGALNALRRMADSTAVKRSETPATVPARAERTAPGRTATPPRGTAAGEVVEPLTAAAPDTQTDNARPITAIAARRTEDAVELRIVAAGQQVPTLSEPFRAGDHSRLFITFGNGRLDLASPPALAEAGTLFAGVDIAERADGVRIALDVAKLGAYELDMTGDTVVLRLAAPSPAATEAAIATPPRLEGPDDLALAREAARAGWAAFRRDAASVASAVGGFFAGAGIAVSATARSAWPATAGGARWLAGSIPFASIARALVLLALLGAPPLFALRLFRRRRSAVHAPAEIAGIETHARIAAVPQKAEKQRKVKKEKKPAVTRTTADARLWAARTLAANGADVAEIARQTGLSREAAILLVRRAQTR